MDQRKLDHVLRQLQSYSGPKKVLNSSSTFVSCPFHSEQTPSGRVFHSPTSRSPGSFKCYGCGQTANWDELAPRLGLQPYKWSKPVAQYTHSRRQEQEEKAPVKCRFTQIPPNKVWRRIRTNLLRKIGCRMGHYTYESGFKQKMLWFPVRIKGEERGFIRARLHKEEGKASYLNAEGGWSRAYGLFPYDYVTKNDPSVIVLVEGPRDALRLISCGVPAMAILGTQSWSQRKSQLVEMTGARWVILCFDGDDAGLKAIELVRPLLKGLVKTRVFSLTGRDSPYWPYRHEDAPTKAAKAAGADLWDPGNMPAQKVRELKTLCKLLESR